MNAIQGKKKKIIENYLSGEAHISCNRLLFAPFDNDDVKLGRYKNLQPALHPCSIKYTAPILPINLFEVANISYLNLFPVVLVRDGLFSMIDFFHRYPVPDEIKTLLIINAQFIPFVPSAWNDQVGFYNNILTENNNYSTREPSFILVKSIMSQSFFSMNFLEKKLLSLKDSEKKILFFIPEREDLFMGHDWVNNPFCYDVLQKIFTILGSKAQMITWTDLLGLSNLEEGRVLDLNESLLGFNDDYLNHHLISRSCFPLEESVSKNEGHGYFIPYSFYHGISIFEADRCGQLCDETNLMKKTLKVPRDKILSKDFCEFIVDLAIREKIKNVWYKNG